MVCTASFMESSRIIRFARFPAFSFCVVCFCMIVSGDFLSAPSVPESLRSWTSSGFRTRLAAISTSICFRRTRYGRHLSSAEVSYRDWPYLWTFIPGGILVSIKMSEQQVGMRMFVDPFTQPGRRFAAESFSWPSERGRQRNLTPGRYVPYQAASAVLLPAIFLKTVLFIESWPSCRLDVGESRLIFFFERSAEGLPP